MEDVQESKVDKRRRLGKRQRLVADLSKKVDALEEKLGESARASVGKVFWARFDKNVMWLPCVVVPPKLLKGSMAQLELAKDALLSKRESVVVFWVTYGMLSKQTLANMVPFEKNQPSPNDVKSLSERNHAFLETALLEVDKFLGENIDMLGHFLQSGIDQGSIAITENEDDETDGGQSLRFSSSSSLRSKRTKFGRSEKRQRPQSPGGLSDIPEDQEEGLAHPNDTGNDPFEPEPPETLSLLVKPDGSLLIALLPNDPVQTPKTSEEAAKGQMASHQSNNDKNVSNGALEQEMADDGNSDEDESGEDDDEMYGDSSANSSESDSDEYKPSSGYNKKKKPGAAQSRKRKVENEGKEKKKVGRPRKVRKTEELAKKSVSRQKPPLVDRLKFWKTRLDLFQTSPFDPQKDATKAEKIVSVLQKLARVKITNDILTESKIGKTISNLRSHSHPQVQTFAKAVRKIWVDKIRKVQDAPKPSPGTAAATTTNQT